MNLKIDYVEFPATDIDATKRFYSNVFGWRFTDYGPDYVSFDGAGIDGGFTTSAQPTPGGVLIVLYTEELEEAQAEVAAAGAEVVDSIFSFPGGRRFHFIDPNGNKVAVWSHDPDQVDEDA